MQTNQKFSVTGMTCSACSASVEKALSKLDGVEEVNVNLLTNSMSVEYDSEITNDDKIIGAVTNAGYGASIFTKDINRELNVDELSTVDEQIKGMRLRFIISIIFLIPLMYISMYHMFYDWFGLPIPSFINRTFNGTENGITFAFTQFLLLIPIIYVNRKYFEIGYKTLAKRSPNMDSLIAIGSSAAVVYGILLYLGLDTDLDMGIWH